MLTLSDVPPLATQPFGQAAAGIVPGPDMKGGDRGKGGPECIGPSPFTQHPFDRRVE